MVFGRSDSRLVAHRFGVVRIRMDGFMTGMADATAQRSAVDSYVCMINS